MTEPGDERPAAPAVNGDMASLESVRVDKWLWAARCFKTRGLASDSCAGGHVKVNGTSVKSAKLLKRGDEISVRMGEDLRIFAVVGLSDRRGPAAVAATLFLDKTPARPPTVEVPGMIVRDRGLGRPNKRELRDIRRVRGY